MFPYGQSSAPAGSDRISPRLSIPGEVATPAKPDAATCNIQIVLYTPC